ncbi:MAG TPA: hypothetical protein VI541_04040, partial [Actinomycetota bacterium]|nr:hypothetical protein [Actinomycetota bacterium]
HHIYVHEAGYTVRGSPPKVIIERPGREPLRVGPPASMNDNNGPHRGPFPLLMDNVALWDRWRGAAR